MEKAVSLLNRLKGYGHKKRYSSEDETVKLDEMPVEPKLHFTPYASAFNVTLTLSQQHCAFTGAN